MSTSWEVQKSDLEYALSIVLNVSAKNGVISSEYIKVSKTDDGAVITLAADMAAEAYLVGEAFPFKKSLFIDRRLFEPFINAGKELKGDTYTLSMKKDGVLTVKHGSRVGIFSVYKKVAGYHDIPRYDSSAQKMRVYESWTKIMQCAAACATDDPVVPQLNCVYVAPSGTKELTMYASNTKVVFVGRGTTKKLPKHPIAFPLILVKALDGNDMENVTWNNKSACLTSERGAIWQPVKSAARKHFPKDELDTLLTAMQKHSAIMTVAAEDMGNAAERIAVYLSAVSREDLVLRIFASKDDRRIKLVAGTGETIFTEHLNLLKPAKADAELHWPLDEVLPTLEFCKNQGTASIFVTTDDGRAMYSTDDVNLVVAKRTK